MVKNIIPTLIWYYYICPREVWLMAHEINPEQDNPLVEIGRTFHEH
ncbi:MAG: CRISPR-associated protein Cas4, partial [Spirochaetes bacterium]